MGCPDWHTAMRRFWLQRLPWIHYPGHVGVCWNERMTVGQAQQISHLVCSLAGQSCSEAWGTSWTWTGQSITALIARRKKEWRNEAADTSPSKVGNDVCSNRQTLALSWGQLYITRQTLALFWGQLYITRQTLALFWGQLYITRQTLTLFWGQL